MESVHEVTLSEKNAEPQIRCTVHTVCYGNYLDRWQRGDRRTCQQ